MPSVLYHYSGLLSGDRLEWMRRLIVESIFYFAPPSEFNDPLDCRIPPTFDATPQEIARFCRPEFKRRYPLESRGDRKERIRRMVMSSKTQDEQERLVEGLFRSLDEDGIACFAKDPANMLLWSYYAEGHKGIAVRFNMAPKHLAAIKSTPIEVQYSKDFPVVNFYKATKDEFLRTILGTKSVAWQHEEEWRLVLRGTVGYVSLPPAMIDGVVLGMRTDPNAEATIREWLKDRVPPVELLRVRHRPRSFVLEVVTA
jgi:Protein of unknown function (DUF2971)